jgi:hypothetical protein
VVVMSSAKALPLTPCQKLNLSMLLCS